MAILDRFEIDSVEYEFQDQKSHNLAAQYSTLATYAVGDYCIKDGDLYKCTTAITTAEAWTAAHWTAAQIAPDLTSQSEKIDEVKTAIEAQPLTIRCTKANYIVFGNLVPFNKTANTDPSAIACLTLLPCVPGERVKVVMPEISGITYTLKYRYGWYKANGDWIDQVLETTSDTFTIPSNAYYFLFGVWWENNGETISNPTLYDSIGDNPVRFQYLDRLSSKFKEDIEELQDEVGKIDEVIIDGKATIDKRILLNKHSMTVGALQTSAMVVVSSAINWLTYLEKIPIGSGLSATIILPTIENVTWHYRYGLYYAADKSYKDQVADTTSNTIAIPSDCGYFSYAFFACDSSGNQLTTYDLMANFPEDGFIKVVLNDDRTDDLAEEKTIIDYANNTFELKHRGNNAGYAIGTDMLKKAISYERIGSLPNETQSFCKYNSKYYATDGTKITVLDSSFETISSETLSLGHGNAFQIGSTNKGYISGWSDNSVYVIDMDNVTIDDTIALPTVEGGTTVAVDDINEIAYIFQRIGSDTAVGTYNFIAYDYGNSNILYQKETTVKYGWMQACDFYEGKIIVLYGGNDASNYERGLFVFNTNGDVISEMKFNIFSEDEPEGVYFDRDNKYLLVSGYVGSVYKIEQF